MRAIWKGAVSFGLVNVPVRLYSATQEHDIRFHQVHREDGGRIRMQRICSVDGQPVSYDQLAKGYEAPDGRLVVLTEEDFEALPLPTSREIDVVEFVPSDQVDPILFNRSYYLEPDARAVKPYALLREALLATDRMAVVKVALRQRETMAVLRVRGDVILLQTLLWPDEVRGPDFDVLQNDVELRPQELQMAASLVESLAADFHPDDFDDEYARALADVVEAKLVGAGPAPAAVAEPGTEEVVDLLTALQRSVERARASREEGGEGDGAKKAAGTAATTTRKAATATKTPAKKAAKAPAKKAAAKSAAPAKAPAKKVAAKKTTTRKAPPRKSA